MRLIVAKDYEELSRAAARIVISQVLAKPESVLAFPTSTTPLGLYAHLSHLVCLRLVDFSPIKVFALDEFLGLPPDRPCSFRSYMKNHVWDPLRLPPERCHIPSSSTHDPDQECLRYDQAIEQAGGLDLAVLGLGLNGHIALNEPGTPWNARTHVAQLAPQTREEHAATFGGLENVPKQAITMGIFTLMHAQKILLLVSGQRKAEILARALRGPVTPEVPASVLQLHPNLTVIADVPAARLL